MTVTADVTGVDELEAALGNQRYDAVVNFLSFDVADDRRMTGFFAGRTRHYLHIISASTYAKPVRQVPITE